MSRNIRRIFVTILAAMLCMGAISINAYAIEVTPSATPSTNTLTPSGAGTVINNATSEEGKEFYTITTPSKHVFYLVIDKQKTAENVYFLDAVTEKDLLALTQDVSTASIDSSTAATSKGTEVSGATNPPSTSTSTSAAEVIHSEKQNNTIKIVVLMSFVLIIAGGAVWFFKFRRPKKVPKGKQKVGRYDFMDTEDDELDDSDESEDQRPEQKDDTISEVEDDE